MQNWTPDNFIISYDLSNTTLANKLCEPRPGIPDKYNELGFRGDSIHKDGFKVMSLGCSLTLGDYVHYDETWSYTFCSKVPNGVNLNFGHRGTSSDFLVRTLITFFDVIKPDLVLILYPYINRREYIKEDGNIFKFLPGFVRDDETDLYNNHVIINNMYDDWNNWYKNHLLITYFLKNKKCNWIWSMVDEPNTKISDFRRFSGSFYKYFGTAIDGYHVSAEGHIKFGNELFNHISLNFPEYLIKNKI